MTITSTTRMMSTRVTRERGMSLISAPTSRERSSLLILVLVAHTPQQPNPITECTIEQNGDPVREGKHDGHHHGGLGDERQAGQPQFDAVPPVEEPVHPARLFDAEMAERRPTATTPTAVRLE